MNGFGTITNWELDTADNEIAPLATGSLRGATKLQVVAQSFFLEIFVALFDASR